MEHLKIFKGVGVAERLRRLCLNTWSPAVSLSGRQHRPERRSHLPPTPSYKLITFVVEGVPRNNMIFYSY